MKLLSGLLYILTGLVCDFVFAVLVGTMLGWSTTQYSLAGFVRTPAVCLGPSMLVLAGAATLLRTNRRLAIYNEASLILLIGIGVWSIPKIGWQDAAWLFLYPESASLLGAILVLLIVRRAWVGTLVGAILSAPFFAYTAVALAHSHLRGSIRYSIEDVTVAVPLALIVLSLVVTLRLRAD